MAKRVPPLTSIQVARLKPDPSKTIELVDGAVPGLRLRISPSGIRSWSLNIRAKGVMRRFEVGSSLGLSEARDRAEQLRLKVRQGYDPTAERRVERIRHTQAKRGVGTLGSIIETYFKNGPGAGLRTAKEQQQRINSVFGPTLAAPSTEVTSPALQMLIDGRKAKTSAARAASYLNPVIKWAKKRGLMSGEFDFDMPIPGPRKQRVLTTEELRALLPFFKDEYGRCCRFILLTACRRDEARYATWDQFDLELAVWTIPGEQRKDSRPQGRRNRKPKPPLEVPLSEQALRLLAEAMEAESIRRRSIQCEREILKEDFVFAGAVGGRLGNWNRWLTRTFENSHVGRWSPHALRRTAATLAGNMGTPPYVISVLLGHSNVGGDLVAGYNHSRYQAEHRQVIEVIGKLVDELEIQVSDESATGDAIATEYCAGPQLPPLKHSAIKQLHQANQFLVGHYRRASPQQ